MFFKKKILFITLLFLLIIVNHQINGQINSENLNKKIFIPTPCWVTYLEDKKNGLFCTVKMGTIKNKYIF